jgi:hypothetical protein
MASASAGKPPPLTKKLNLAQTWAKDFGSSVERGTATPEGGTPEAILILDKTAIPVLVRDAGKNLVVFGVLDIPEELRKKLSDSDEVVQKEFLIRLRQELMASPRTAFSTAQAPGAKPNSMNPGDITRVQVEQRVRISEDDFSSANRFWDSTQEIRTTVFRVSQLFGFLGAPSKSTQSYTSSTPVPEIYR